MKAICVFSGGLDSMLAAQLIRGQGIEVLALFFETPFFSHHRAEQSARVLNLPFKVLDITQRHLKMVKAPKHGYGGNMNPCIDCHALMIRIAGEMLEPFGASFIFTGEVLGQRPMSQNRQSLAVVARDSGFAELLLRPLSARLLEPTAPEKKEWVRRDLLLDFQGRSRKPQMELARAFNITDFPEPAGGCRLTEKFFTRRLRDLFASRAEPEIREIEVLKLGRHFRIAPNAKLVVGRDEKENQRLESIYRESDLILTGPDDPGPTVLGFGEFTDEHMALAAAITASYSDVKDGDKICIRAVKGGKERILKCTSPGKEEFRRYMI
jgi:tRNA-uridine 2-sulfurtransferase